jgi:S1-C subfamily serine protease
VTAEIRILSGARSGQTIAIVSNAVVGRQADADLCFDPEQDLTVSGRHAIIGRDQSGWFIRDLESRNGTFLNGERVQESRLRDGDRIAFGWQGPEVEFHVGDTASAGAPPPTAPQATSVTRVIRENARLRRATSLLAILLVAVVGTFLWISKRQRTQLDIERRNLEEMVNRVLAASDSTLRRLAGERQELGDALRQSQTEVRDVRDRLHQKEGARDSSSLPDLRRQLQTALVALERQQLAAALDYPSIERASRTAVAVVWVETPGGEVRIGTGFSVRPDATLLTNRHIIVDDEGHHPRRLAVQFTDSYQVFPARVLTISDDADLAVIKVDNIIGDVPTVRGLNERSDTVRSGVAVAWIGFPLGGETWPQDTKNGRIARPLGAAGVIMSTRPDEFEIQGYGAAGVSGSPVFDARGEVVAVLYGGTKGEAGQVLYAIPISKAEELLAGLRR